ncbi:MAG: hypothetical protein EP329_26285 [Deltaproteobacteria bacterium]|nr:MAG: hypothetical protein EP329_26285 [Deltaproteobacteria bacterium]
MRTLVRALVVWLAVLAPGALHAAEPAADNDLPLELMQRITQGESAFKVQNYPRVIELLKPLAGHRLLKGQRKHRDVLEWLGVSQWLSSQEDDARLTFAKLILEWPNYHLDELLYPPELVQYYEARRKEMIDLGVVDPNRDPNVKKRLVLIRHDIEREVPTIAYFAPFGVGQFANDEAGKGTVVVVLEVLGLAATAGTWLAIEGLKDEQGYVRAADEGKVTALNALWIAGAAIFAGAYIYSVTDGLLNEPDGAESDLRYELIDIDALPPPPDSAQIELIPGPGEVGLGLGLTF